MGEITQLEAYGLVDLECDLHKESLQPTENKKNITKFNSSKNEDTILSSDCIISNLGTSNIDSNSACRKTVPAPCKNPASVAKRNARERKRIKNVNKAFDELRQHVPLGCHNKKISKVDTLQSAIEYIKALEQLVKQKRNVEDDKENDISSNQSNVPSDQQARCLISCPGDNEEEAMYISSQLCQGYETTPIEQSGGQPMLEQCNLTTARPMNEYTADLMWLSCGQSNTSSSMDANATQKDANGMPNMSFSSLLEVKEYEDYFGRFVQDGSASLKPLNMDEVPLPSNDTNEDRMEKLPDSFDQSMPFVAFQDGYRFGDECT